MTEGEESQGQLTDSLFRRTEPTPAEIADFHRDGCIIYPDIITDEAREGLIGEVTSWEPARRFIELSDEARQAEENPGVFFGNRSVP